MRPNNISMADRLIRLILSVFFIALYLTNLVTGAIGIVLVMIAVILTATALVSYCPLYTMFGIHKWEKRHE